MNLKLHHLHPSTLNVKLHHLHPSTLNLKECVILECVYVVPVEMCDDVFEDLVVDLRKLLHDLSQHLETFDVVHDF